MAEEVSNVNGSEGGSVEMPQEISPQTQDGMTKEVTGDQPPAEPEAYKWQHAEGIPFDDAVAASFIDLAKSLGLTNDQLGQINEWNNKGLIDAANKQKASIEQYQKDSEAALRKEWGDKYDLNVKYARDLGNMVEKKVPGTLAFLKQTRLGDSPEFIRILASVGEMISEDSLTGTSGGSTQDDRKVIGGMPILDFPSMKVK